MKLVKDKIYYSADATGEIFPRTYKDISPAGHMRFICDTHGEVFYDEKSVHVNIFETEIDAWIQCYKNGVLACTKLIDEKEQELKKLKKEIKETKRYLKYFETRFGYLKDDYPESFV